MSTNQLKKDSLGVGSIIFFVIAAASPITGVVGAMPIAFMAGNGAGVPAVYLLAGFLLMLFACGFVAMSRHVVNAGAFYSYISVGLGRKFGLAALNIALLAYTAIQIAVVAMFGFFTQMFITEHCAITLPWWLYSAAMLITVLLFGVQHVELGGKVLGILMLAEVGIILLTDSAILAHKPLTSMDWSSFSPAVAGSGAVGIAMIFAISSFIGFEATAIYSEECRNPTKTVPRATFIAVTLITIFFAFTSWCFVQQTGTAKIAEVAAKDPGSFVFDIAAATLGAKSVVIMSLLLITSLFAAAQAFHNAMSRYIFAMSRDGFLAGSLSKVHAKYGTPYRASIAQTIFMLMVLFLLAFSEVDPLQGVFAWGSALGTISILLLQGGVSIAVICYFHKQKNPDLTVSRWSGFVAPGMAAIGMFFALGKVIQNLDVLSGSESSWIFLLPYVVVAVAGTGYLYAQYLASYQPVRFSKLGQIFDKLV